MNDQEFKNIVRDCITSGDIQAYLETDDKWFEISSFLEAMDLPNSRDFVGMTEEIISELIVTGCPND